jgi:hypothetical protein
MVARFLLALAGLFTLGVCPGIAQSTLNGPSLGLFFDPMAHAIRPIWGILGSATAGQPMDVGFPLAAGLISALQDYALVVAGDGSMSVITFTPNGPAVQPIRGTAGTPDLMFMSPGGTSAALYYRNSASAQILTSLPSSPQIARQVDLSMLPNAPDVIAISDDGSLLLAGVPENTACSPAQGEVFVFTPDAAAPQSVASVQHASAIEFLTKSHDALVADDDANSVSLMLDVANGANVAWVFSSQQLLAPDSVQASPDRQSFLAGSSTNSIVAILDAGGSNAVVVACGCAPAELRPLNAASTYQITEPANGLLWILDGQLSYPRVFFVPIPNVTGPTNVRKRRDEGGTTRVNKGGGQP